MPDGSYTIRLHFAEPNFNAINQRKFDILLQGVLVQNDYDVRAAAGAIYKATTLTFPVTASADGGIILELENVLTQAFINGIEIFAANPLGQADPTLNLELSNNDGASWCPLANNLTMDRFGRGSYLWNIPAGQAEGSQYRIRAVANVGGTVQDTSDEAFLVANSGQHYYVNDASTTGDSFTTAIGNNLNSGKSPSQPMLTLQALLDAYNLGAGDVVHVDAGTYQLMRNIVITGDDSGVRVEGPTTGTAVFDRGNVNQAQNVFDLQNADNVTLDRLSITGGVYGIYASGSSDSDNFTISNSTVFGNSSIGVLLEGTNDFSTIRSNLFYGVPGAPSGDEQPYGVVLRGNDGTIATNTLTVGANEGITVSGARHAVNANDVSGYNTGIYAHSGGAGADWITVSGNRTHDNITYGIYATTNVLVADNVVFNQAGTNDIGIYSAGGNTEVRDNVVQTNFIGIQTSDTYVTENWIFNNSSAGIETYGNARISSNHVYSNSIGIRNGYNFYGEITNNLIYANTNQGILFQSYQVSSEDKEVTNNTIYQLVGDAVRLEAGTNRVKLRNNIISVQAGYDISVGNDSQTGFESNYNVLHQGTDANAHVGFWGGSIRDSLADWQAASSQDANSLAADPQFVDLDGADNTLGYAAVGGGFRDGGPDDNFYRRKFSPATDRGDSWNTTPTDLEGFARVDDPGTPNSGRNDYFHSVLGSSLFTATGTAQPTWRSNSNSFSYTLPFAFNFYGTSYTTVYVSTEGFLQFGDNNSSGDSANTAAKLLQLRRIAPVWDNLRIK